MSDELHPDCTGRTVRSEALDAAESLDTS